MFSRFFQPARIGQPTQNRNTRKPHARTQSRLTMERLEERAMMASDLKALFENNGVRIFEATTNVGGSQAVEVFQANGRLVIEGLFLPNGTQTKINGKTHVEFALPKNLSIELGGGNDIVGVNHINLGTLSIGTPAPANSTASDIDSVVVSNVSLLGSLAIRTGKGRDAVSLAAVSAGGDVNINTSDATATALADDDTVAVIGGNLRGKTHIETGAGGDNVIIDTSTLGDAATDVTEIFTGAGKDIVQLGPTPGQGSAPVLVAGNLDVRMAASLTSSTDKDVDVLRVRDTTVRENLYAKLGSGNDQVELDNVTAFKTILLEGQGDADTMKLTEVEAADGFFALMGDGDDILDITGLRGRRMSVVGGSGFDKFFKFGIDTIPSDSIGITSFEQINGLPVLIATTPASTPAKKI